MHIVNVLTILIKKGNYGQLGKKEIFPVFNLLLINLLCAERRKEEKERRKSGEKEDRKTEN